MAVSIDWGTRIITVLQADMTPLGGDLYEFDVDAFRLDLKDLEDGEDGIVFPDTHVHSTTVTVGGVVYARKVEIINGYTVTISPAGSYQVSCKGAIHNIQDVYNNLTGPTLLPNNSVGLVETAVSGLTTDESTKLDNVNAVHWHERIADDSTAIETVYEDDGVSIRKQFRLWKDKDKTIPYDGVGGIAARSPI